MVFLIDPSDLVNASACKKKGCDAVCTLCTLCDRRIAPLYGVVPTDED